MDETKRKSEINDISTMFGLSRAVGYCVGKVWELKNRGEHELSSWYMARYMEMLNIEEAAREDVASGVVASARRGKWVKSEENNDGSARYTCSNCGEQWFIEDGSDPLKNGYNFCPCCGKQMGG